MKEVKTIQNATKAEIQRALLEQKKELKPRKCELCDGLFEPKRQWQKFCGGKCRVSWFRLKDKIEKEKADAATLLE